MEKIKYPKTSKIINFENYPALKFNWIYSYKILEKLNEKLNNEINDDKNISIVVAGSFGRLDASTESDLDYIILVERYDIDVEKIKKIVEKIANELNIKLPSLTGVFSEIIPINDMIKKTGSTDDNLTSLAQRLLLLMESRPIYNEVLFRSAVDRILRKYLELVIEDTTKETLFFLNDIIRYFRSICVNYQFNFWKEETKWVIRNVKLRHSRITMYAGMLLLCLNSSKYIKNGNNKFSYISSKIELTPLEKIVHVYQDNIDLSFTKILGISNVYIRKISDPTIRKALQTDYEDRYLNPYYSELKVASDALQTELTRFIFAQKEHWTDAIYEYLIF